MCGLPAPTFAQTADEILNRHIAAIGGIKNWDKVKTVIMTGTMTSDGSSVQMVQTVANDKGWRMDIKLGGQNCYYIITPTEGWVFMPGQLKAETIPAIQLGSFKDKLNFKNSQLVDKSAIAKVTLAGTDSANHCLCYKLNVIDRDGEQQYCYIDKKTYYMVRIERSLKTDEGDQVMAIDFSNFTKRSEGITFPTSFNSPEGNVELKQVDLNKPVDDRIFKP